MINKYPEIFVEKLGPNGRVNCKPIKLEVDKRKAEQMRPTNYIKPYDGPYHLRESFQREIFNMLEVGIIERYEVFARCSQTCSQVCSVGTQQLPWRSL